MKVQAQRFCNGFGRVLSMPMLLIFSTFHSPAEVPIANRPVLANPEITAALSSAWIATANGTLGIEASFRLDGSESAYRIVVTELSNQRRFQTVPLIPGVTFAIF